jgi:hypothetical protein
MRYTRFSNAYMLVYVREDDWDEIMCSVGKEELQVGVEGWVLKGGACVLVQVCISLYEICAILPSQCAPSDSEHGA